MAISLRVSPLKTDSSNRLDLEPVAPDQTIMEHERCLHELSGLKIWNFTHQAVLSWEISHIAYILKNKENWTRCYATWRKIQSIQARNVLNIMRWIAERMCYALSYPLPISFDEKEKLLELAKYSGLYIHLGNKSQKMEWRELVNRINYFYEEYSLALCENTL